MNMNVRDDVNVLKNIVTMDFLIFFVTKQFSDSNPRTVVSTKVILDLSTKASSYVNLPLYKVNFIKL